jgi:hypothetical protein
MAIMPVSFDAAMKLVDGKGNPHLLLGNGFSIALRPSQRWRLNRLRQRARRLKRSRRMGYFRRGP